MPAAITGFPFWEAEFDKDVAPVGQPADDIIRQIADAQLTDLFVFSHGWNNDKTTAEKLYSAFFATVRKLIDNPAIKKVGTARIGVLGIIWPSILWPDEVPPALKSASPGGGAAGIGAPPQSVAEIPYKALKDRVFDESQHTLLDELQGMLKSSAKSDAALRTFRNKLSELLAAPAAASGDTDAVERDVIGATGNKWPDVLKALAGGERPAAGAGGAAGIGDVFDTMWNGAKGALRIATFWQMKERAGVIGRTGLGPMISKLAGRSPDTRIHLIGHSFGARLVSYALAGLAPVPAGQRSPVKSLLLLQGAFSHFAFADALPFDRARKGDLHGMSTRVDGPLLATFSAFDLAVGRAYPLGAYASGQDAAAKAVARWGGMGSDGAQAVKAAGAPLAQTGKPYAFVAGKWTNLDGNKIIKTGGLPSGAHSDIIHPEIAWALLSAAKLV